MLKAATFQRALTMVVQLLHSWLALRHTLLCWGAIQVYLSEYAFYVAGHPLQFSDKRSFLKEAVDYCRENVRFTFNGN